MTLFNRLSALLAVAGGITGLVAFYLSAIQPRRLQPRLEVLAYDADSGDCAIFDGVSTWIRLRVRNDAKKNYAADAQAAVVSIRPVGQAARRVGLPDLALNENRLLAWSDMPEDSVAMYPGVARRVDLLSRTSDTEMCRLTFHDAPTDGRDRLLSGEYVLVLALTAKNGQPRFQKVQLRLPASWSPGQSLPGECVTLLGKASRRFGGWE